ncbi:oxidoreductase [Colletotrichum paranaense]|nr:oxidoreductase [Colletotrichum paranaense]KAK1533135.1 oxidoreductase [Colletotrichum paranaense]
MATDNSFPVISFSSYHNEFDAFAREVFSASQNWGFFILTDHGIPQVDDMFDMSKEFFDLPMEQKATHIIDGTLTGYDGKKLTTFAASEGISFGMPAGSVLTHTNLPNWWTASKRRDIESFKSSCYGLSLAIISTFASQLGIEKTSLTKFHKQSAPGNVLKFIKYPHFDEKPDAIPRLSEHTDWGSITFVFTEKSGLEIRDPSNNWFHIPVIPGGVVVNIGDALSLWSNGALKSTMHRISWKNLDIAEDRLSIVYFTHPNNDAILSSLTESEKPDAEALPLTYEKYLKIRSVLTYGSLRELKDGGVPFEDIDPRALEQVRGLCVANSGILESHARNKAA